MTYYTYTKMNLLDGFLLYCSILYFILNISIFKLFTLNYIFNWGQIYHEKVNAKNPKKYIFNLN